MDQGAGTGERCHATALLPEDVLSYLRDARRRGLANPVGIYRPGTARLAALPYCAAGAGIALLGIVAHLATSPDVRFDDASNISGLSLACGAAAALLGLALLWCAGHWRTRGLGSFEFLGPSAWWVVGPLHVHERPWRQLVGIDGQHRMLGSAFQDSRISAQFSFGQRTITTHDRRWAETFYRFADTAAKLTQRGLPEGMVGTIARAAAQERPIVEPEGGWPDAHCPALPSSNLGARRATTLAWLAALAVVGSAGYAGATIARSTLPTVASARQEVELHRTVTAAAATDVAPAFEYLRRFPDGAHADAVRGILERQLLAKALADARKARSIAPVQKYIAARPHSRLVPEATAYIRSQLAEGQRLLSIHVASPKPMKAAHRRMADVLAVLLAEAAKTGEVRVLVTARETARVAPTSDAMRRREREFEHAFVDRDGNMYTGGDPRTWNIRSTVSLVPTGDAFGDAWKLRRQHYAERRIAERLSALPGGSMLRFDGTTTEPVARVDATYHLRPNGKHVRLDESGFLTGLGPTSMLREYVVDWRLTVRSSTGKVLAERRFTSERPKDMAIYGSTSDPAWGRYAMTLAAAIDAGFKDSPGAPIGMDYEYSKLVAMQ